jgi:hypothetical protein
MGTSQGPHNHHAYKEMATERIAYPAPPALCVVMVVVSRCLAMLSDRSPRHFGTAA